MALITGPRSTADGSFRQLGKKIRQTQEIKLAFVTGNSCSELNPRSFTPLDFELEEPGVPDLGVKVRSGLSAKSTNSAAQAR